MLVEVSVVVESRPFTMFHQFDDPIRNIASLLGGKVIYTGPTSIMPRYLLEFSSKIMASNFKAALECTFVSGVRCELL